MCEYNEKITEYLHRSAFATRGIKLKAFPSFIALGFGLKNGPPILAMVMMKGPSFVLSFHAHGWVSLSPSLDPGCVLALL